MEKYILIFGKIYSKYIVRGSGSVWVYLSTILKVQVWFRFTEVKICWFRFGLGSPKQNGSFGFAVSVQVWFDTLLKRPHLNRVVQVLTGTAIYNDTRKLQVVLSLLGVQNVA